jgi:amino acid adenylation domain-containing protein
MPEIPGHSVLRRWTNFFSKKTTSSSATSAEIHRFWQARLANLPALLELPSTATNATPGHSQGNLDKGGNEAVCIPPPLFADIQRLAASENTNPYVVLLGVYFTLLYRYSSQEDILISVTGPSRLLGDGASPSAGSSELVAFRLKISGNSPFHELLTRLKQEISLASRFLAVTWQEILQATAEQDPAPLCQARFAIEGSVTPDASADGNPAEADLQLRVQQHPDQLQVQCDYQPSRFTPETIQGLLSHYQNLLSAVCRDPHQPISELPLLSPEERQRLLTTWNDTRVEFPTASAIHELFESRVAESPDTVAIAYQDQYYSYQTVNERADQLANYLRSLGVGPDILVGIYMERSPDAVIAMLAVLKAGGAYLPLDASYPDDRIAYIMADARSNVLLTHAELATRLQTSPATIICLDADREKIAQHSPQAPENRTRPEHLAFVLYTSGSTGDPKGVEVTHGNLINYYFLWEHSHHLRESINGVFQMAFFSFAVFQGDVIRALCAGKKLVICPQETLLSPRLMYELMQREQADFAEFVPVLLRGLLEFVEPSDLRLDFMRVMIVGADRWYVREHRRVQRLCGPQTLFVHVYGLSETTLDSTYFVTTDSELDENQLVPIGRPFPNVQAYVLDDHQQPVPIGVPGTLYVGGAGIAKGYHNRPGLTAERFIADPFSKRPGARLYNTGDLASYLSDGNIAFLGRGDQQVKIRGFRVELGEVEARLEEHPAIRTALVQAWQPSAGTTQLAAYYVGAGESAPSPGELQEFLGNTLPDFMIPAYFVALDALPLTPSGKINRRALPDPRQSLAQAGGELPDSSDEIERTVTSICKHALGLTELAPDARFEALGSDSMAIMTMVTGLENNFAINVDEDDIGPELFANVRTLTAYVRNKIGPTQH